MKFTVTCPSCKEETSMIYIIVALTPFSFKCGSCRARIYIKGVTLSIIGLMILMGALSILALQYIFYTGKIEGREMLFFLIPAVIIIVLEFVTGVIVCNKAKLVVKSKKGGS